MRPLHQTRATRGRAARGRATSSRSRWLRRCRGRPSKRCCRRQHPAASAQTKPPSSSSAPVRLERRAVRRRRQGISVSFPAVRVAGVPRRIAGAPAVAAGAAGPDDHGDVEQLGRDQPADRRAAGIAEGDMVEVASAHGHVRAPALISPGIAPDVVAMPVGQGHETFTRYASGRGANPISILAPATEPETGALAWAATRVKVTRVGDAEWQPDPVCRRDCANGPNMHAADEESSTDGTSMGNGVDLDRCTGLRGLRDGVPCREQHPDRRRRRRRRAAARCTGFASSATGKASFPDVAAEVPAGAVPAVRRRAVRAGVPDLRQPSHRGRAERAGLQPLHRHALLRQRLPVQRPLLQLLQPAVGQAAPSAAQSRRLGPRSRRDGEVHVLRAAHQARRRSARRRRSAS